MDDCTEKTSCHCPFLGQCAFIDQNQEKMPELVSRLRDKYCTKESHCECARFQIYELPGDHTVPPLMLPDQIDWARQIIEELDRESELEDSTVKA